MPQFLLDANLSYETARFLNSLGHPTKTVADFNLAEADDQTILRFSSWYGYCLVTLDLDFGYLFEINQSGQVSIVILRLYDQTVESVNMAIERLLATGILNKKENRLALLVVDEISVRVRR